MNFYFARTLATALFATVVVGCAGESKAKENDGIASKLRLTRGAGIDIGAKPYRAGTLAAVGGLSGTVRLEGTAPADTVRISTDERICGTVAPSRVQTGSGGGLANTVVWVADAATGKRLPMEKRVVVSSTSCLIDPRVQATVVGAAVNVFNDDKLLHKLVFLRAGTQDTIVVMPFFNNGQVVTSEELAKTSGIVEVRCALHPWTRGYLAVFDHPYYAVTEKDGRFSIDSLPPGNYRLMAWHEGMSKPVEQRVKIDAGQTGKVDLGLAIGAGQD